MYSADLRAIANQCPLSGGPAVYLARTLVRMIDPLVRYDDELTCYQSGYSWRIGKEEKNSIIVLYPNPAGNTVTIHNNAVEEVAMEVFDEIGKLVMFEKLNSTANETTINVSKLHNGVYSCKFTIDKKVEVKPLVVLH